MTTKDRLAPALRKVTGAKDRKKLVKDLAAATKQFKFIPWPGPQTEAYVSKADELFYGGAAGGGKRLDIDTEIPTISGWTMMGEIKPGDMVFSVDGSPTRVTAVSEIALAPRSFEVVFDTGETLNGALVPPIRWGWEDVATPYTGELSQSSRDRTATWT